MTTRLHSLPLVWLVLACVSSEPVPAPGRVPKVYNALITSNQNLEPSKAYPVYQPVIHDPFAYPFQPAIFYGDYPISNNLNPAAIVPPNYRPKEPNVPNQLSPPAQPPAPADDSAPPSPESPSEGPSPQDSSDNSTPAPPAPPTTQSPIPLNQFGLPSQVYPLGRFNPAFDGYTQIGPFTYPYPGLRFYDPYDPYSLNPYANLPPLYRPLPSVFSQGQPGAKQAPPAVPPAAPAAPGPADDQPRAPADSDSAVPPPEPSDLNALNYSSKDPSIPNVPPPPIPQGGLTDNKSE